MIQLFENLDDPMKIKKIRDICNFWKRQLEKDEDLNLKYLVTIVNYTKLNMKLALKF